ncbi:hypothetical protein [Haladaptatus salinisoli]|nr:hypothetical protein [Haladaptatus salinisoli]
MADFTNVPARPDTKQRIADLRFDMRVNSMDAVLRELLETYDQKNA